MAREVWVRVKTMVKVKIDDIPHNNEVSTSELVDTVMENCDYRFSYDENGLEIVNTELEEWEVEEEV